MLKLEHENKFTSILPQYSKTTLSNNQIFHLLCHQQKLKLLAKTIKILKVLD